jgi:uncharacterized protein (TIGR03083 family)
MSAMTDTAYRLVRTRVDALLRPLTSAAVETVVPGCPQWTVRDTLCHLVGACADILAGRGDATGSPAWTAAQVAARQGQLVADLLDEWAITGEQVAAALAGRSALGQVVMDALTHELDLRNALGTSAPTDDPALEVALAWIAPRFGRYLDHVGAPALRLVLDPDGAEVTLGSGEPAACLRATRLDVLRSLTGRRSLAQVRALAWDGDPTPWLAALSWGPFSPPGHDVEAVGTGPIT